MNLKYIQELSRKGTIMVTGIVHELNNVDCMDILPEWDCLTMIHCNWVSRDLIGLSGIFAGHIAQYDSGIRAVER